MVPVRQTRLHAVMGLLLVGAVQPVAIAGGQVESVDLLSFWMTYTVASLKGVCCSKALTVGRDQAAHARKGSPRSTLRLRWSWSFGVETFSCGNKIRAQGN
jgi:hypothetical protein